MSFQGSRKGGDVGNLEVRGQFLEAEAHSCLEKGGGGEVEVVMFGDPGGDTS